MIIPKHFPVPERKETEPHLRRRYVHQKWGDPVRYHGEEDGDASARGVIHVGFREVRRLRAGLQQIVNYWIFHDGFNIGIGDTVADRKPETMEYITEQIIIRKDSVAGLLEDA